MSKNIFFAVIVIKPFNFPTFFPQVAKFEGCIFIAQERDLLFSYIKPFHIIDQPLMKNLNGSDIINMSLS